MSACMRTKEHPQICAHGVLITMDCPFLFLLCHALWFARVVLTEMLFTVILKHTRHGTSNKTQKHLWLIPLRYINSYTANKQIKELYRNSDTNDTNAIDKAFRIFHNVKGPRNHFLLNTMLRFCIHHKDVFHLNMVWGHIRSAERTVQREIAYESLIRFHVTSDNVVAAMEVLKWLGLQQIRLKVQDSIIIKLISKCDVTTDLDIVHRLIQYNIIKTECARKNPVITALIRKYGHLRAIEGAAQVFESLTPSERDMNSIQTMMRIFVDNGYDQRALDLYRNVANDSLIKATTHSLALRACCNMNDFDRGDAIISIVQKHIKSDIKLQTAFIEFYGHFGHSDKAMEIFKRMKQRDIIAVGTMMKVLCNEQLYETVLEMYNEVDSHLMIHHDAITHSLALKSCGHLKQHDRGRKIHHILKRDELDKDIRVSTALIEFYGYCQDTKGAQKVFGSVTSTEMDTVCIGAMMTALINNEEFEETLNLFDRTVETARIRKMDICHLAIKCCVGNNDFVSGERIISQFAIWKRLDSDRNLNVDILNTVIAFYGYFGEMEHALGIFNAMDGKRGIVTYNAMMTAFINNEYYREALDLYDCIDGYGLVRDEMTHSLGIKACGCINDVDKGKEIIANLGLDLDKTINLQIANTLIDFYGHCGDLESSLRIFRSIPEDKKDIVTINAMMASYIGNGKEDAAEELFHFAMRELGLKADSKTFSIRLNACSHFGDSEKAMKIWNDEISDEKMKYDHYIITCVVDCYSRKGLLHDARDIIGQYEFATNRPYYSMWIALLSAARSQGESQIASSVFTEIEKRFSSNESVMSRAKVLLSHTLHRGS